MHLSEIPLVVRELPLVVGVLVTSLDFVKIVERLKHGVLIAEDESLEEVGRGVVELIRGVLGHGHSEDTVGRGRPRLAMGPEL